MENTKFTSWVWECGRDREECGTLGVIAIDEKVIKNVQILILLRNGMNMILLLLVLWPSQPLPSLIIIKLLI